MFGIYKNNTYICTLLNIYRFTTMKTFNVHQPRHQQPQKCERGYYV